MNEAHRHPPHWRERLVLRRSARARYVRLKLHPGGKLELVVPHGFDERHLPAILDRHEAWVLRHLPRLEGQAALQPVPAPRRIALAALGEQWCVSYLGDDGGRHGCRASGEGQLRVSGGLHWQQGLRRWLARRGREQLVPWLGQVSEEIGLPFSGATVRGQRTRWGSCSSRRHINLNFGLLFLPPHLVRYLFVHELCHTRHMNHSADYWRLVATVEPDYRSLERALRQAGKTLPAWLHADEIVAV